MNQPAKIREYATILKMRVYTPSCNTLRNALGFLRISLLTGAAAAQDPGANNLHENRMLQRALVTAS